MKSDFLLAITQLSAEKNLSREVVLAAVESALISAYRKYNFSPNQNLDVKINPANGKVDVWAEKIVVEKALDRRSEISLNDARKIKTDAQLEDALMVLDTPRNAGRIAAQTAKQVILQRLHDAEHSAILEEFSDKEGNIITGMVQRIEGGRQIYIDVGRAEALLPLAEQVHTEHYRVGQRLKVYLVEVARTTKGSRVVVSRSHPSLLRRLFELEIPEVFNGIVEIKSVAREAGHRSKVAVSGRQEGIDPVGCCVGLRGIRIQNIVNELNGEKIDVVTWDPSVAIFIANALSPAQVVSVTLNETEKLATVVIPDRQLSLAIGKEGQNVRLAAKLTEWRIDIKSASVAEQEKMEAAQQRAEKEALAALEAPQQVEVSEPVVEEFEAAVAEEKEAEPVAETADVTTAETLPVEDVPEPLTPVTAEAETASEEELLPEDLGAEETAETEEDTTIEELEQGVPVSEELLSTKMEPPAKGEIRFAEDILPSYRLARRGPDNRKKKNTTRKAPYKKNKKR